MRVYDYVGLRLGRERSQMETAHKEGWQEGWQEGRQQGEQVGLQKAALSMLKMGLTKQQVAAATDLNIIEIENIMASVMSGIDGQSNQEE